jgi:hypothetical protein
MHSVIVILEESTDSAGPDLVSLDNLKFALGITGTEEDAALQAAITFQSRIIAEYCDRHFGMAEVLETFTFDPGETLRTRNALVLSHYPVVDVLEIDNVGATGDGFDFDPPSGRLWIDGNSSGIVTVNYVGGYDLPEGAPARLSKAVIEAVNETRLTSGRDPSIREVQHGDTRISYFTSNLATASPGFLSAPVMDLIKPFRRLYAA